MYNPTSSPRSSVPLLSLAPPALALGDDLTVGQFEHQIHAGGIWNVIKRAADLVKDGERLENLAWRHWSQHQSPQPRRLSTSSSCSTASLQTPPPSIYRKPSFERRSFGGSLKLLTEKDHFIDWVGEAKRRLPIPTISVPDTPIANVEIRLVEPTPVPSRVGSLGQSMNTGGLLSAAAVPPMLYEEDEEEVIEETKPSSLQVRIPRSPRKRGKFFVESSGSKGSGSESPASPVKPSLPGLRHGSDSTNGPAKRKDKAQSGSDSPASPVKPLPQPRRSSGSSTGAAPKRKDKRHVSLSTMRGKFMSEKRKVAAALDEAQAANEESGWEDDAEEEQEEEWSDDEPGPRPQLHHRNSTRSNASASNLDLAELFTRQPSRRSNKVPPPPAPTPLRKMSKKERLAAEAERAKIEAELEAQRKREMFAKQQIFGSSRHGLLTGMLSRGNSMVNLGNAAQKVRPSPTYSNLPTLAHGQSPIGPSLLRSKSAVAIPVQTGLSVTATSHSPLVKSEENNSNPSVKSEHSAESARRPSDVELETSDEESEDDYLATSATRRKIDALAAKRAGKNAVPIPIESAIPNSPTTQRRQMIMREMSESLRKNLILERQKSSGAVPRVPPRTSITSRQSSTFLYQPAGQDPPDQEFQPPRARPSILGSGFLRPLTRVGTTSPKLQPQVMSGGLNRTQSSATLYSTSPQPARPSADANRATPMLRSSTEGAALQEHQERRRLLAKRRETTDTSYRLHGW